MTEAFVTMALADDCAMGALVLACSLKQVKTTKKMCILVGPSVSDPTIKKLQNVFDEVRRVNLYENQEIDIGELLTKPEMKSLLIKFNCWMLTHYTKCVFMAATTMATMNIDELFEREELSAAPDTIWPDLFNPGVFVFRPSKDTYNSLIRFVKTTKNQSDGEQLILNLFFSDWATKDISRHLPFVYNAVTQAFYSYLPAFKRYGKEVKVVQFVGYQMPWYYSQDYVNSVVDDEEHGGQYIGQWWKLFTDQIKPTLYNKSTKKAGSTKQATPLASSSSPPFTDLGHVSQKQDTRVENAVDGVADDPADEEGVEPRRQHEWERGNIDYMGVDSFENIQRQLDEKLNISYLRKISGTAPANAATRAATLPTTRAATLPTTRAATSVNKPAVTPTTKTSTLLASVTIAQ